jgi:hypothetical protein
VFPDPFVDEPSNALAIIIPPTNPTPIPTAPAK